MIMVKGIIMSLSQWYTFSTESTYMKLINGYLYSYNVIS